MTYDIPGYPGYKLTEDFKILGKLGRILKDRSDKPITYSSPYLLVCCALPDGNKTLYVHNAIALVHVKGWFEGAVVDHIDRNPRNNHPSNLRWVTQSTNSRNRPNSDTDETRIHHGYTDEQWEALPKKTRYKLVCQWKNKPLIRYASAEQRKLIKSLKGKASERTLRTRYGFHSILVKSIWREESCHLSSTRERCKVGQSK